MKKISSREMACLKSSLQVQGRSSTKLPVPLSQQNAGNMRRSIFSVAVPLHEEARKHVVMAAAPPAKPAAGNPSQPVTPPRAGKKKAKKLVDINGDVNKDLGNGMFNIKLENGVTVMAHLSGKIRQNRIKILMGDKVTVELSPYDLTKGRITYRFRPGEYDRLQQAAAAAAASVTAA